RANSEKVRPIGRGERSLSTDYKSGTQSLSFREAHRGYALRSSKRETLRSRTILSKTTRHSLSTRPAPTPIAQPFLRGRANSEKGRPIGRAERSLFTDYKSGKQSLSFREEHHGLANTGL